MKATIRSVCVSLALLLISCSHSEDNSIPVVQTEKYGAVAIGALGDSYCGTVATNPPISYDCGPLAGTYASGGQPQKDGRCVVRRTAALVAATIMEPPGAEVHRVAPKRSKYYPINVFSRSQEVTEQELVSLAFAIEAAVLKK